MSESIRMKFVSVEAALNIAVKMGHEPIQVTNDCWSCREVACDAVMYSASNVLFNGNMLSVSCPAEEDEAVEMFIPELAG
jgi:hypothetical protein